MTSKEIVLSAMRTLGKADAKDLLSRIPGMTDTEIINEEEKIPEFDNSKDYSSYEANVFCVRDGGQVWALLQPYNAADYPDAGPSGLRAIWGLKHHEKPAEGQALRRAVRDKRPVYEGRMLHRRKRRCVDIRDG